MNRTRVAFNLRKLTTTLLLVVVGSSYLTVLSHAKNSFESPRVMKASEILPKQLLSGANCQIGPNVANDGYINTYVVKSNFGEITVASTAALKIRVREFDAVAKMVEVEKSDSYKKAADKAGKNTLSGVKTMVKHPVKSVKGAVSGVGKMFQRAGESFNSEKGAGEDNSFEQMIGFSKAKMAVAREFGVDVYSPNPILQEHLASIAWASFGGNMSIAVVKALVPGGLGIALSVSDNAQKLNDTIMTTPASELKVRNRKVLQTMGVPQAVIEAFMDNPNFTPREQTQLVAALADMKTAQGREAFAKFAALTRSQDVAFFRQRSAMKYAAYSRKKTPIKRFIPIGQFVAASTGNTLVFIVPVDYLIWSENTARIAQGLDQKVKAMPEIKQKELWLSGTVSPLARQQLTSSGWKIYENSDDLLLADFIRVKGKSAKK